MKRNLRTNLSLGVLALLSAFSPLSVHAQGTPAAILSAVRGKVQVVRGGKTLAGKAGTQLFTGDRVRVVSGSATVFSATSPTKTVSTGKEIIVGAGGATSNPSVWRSVFKSVSGGFSQRMAKVPATMRPPGLESRTPANSKVLPGELSFTWAYEAVEAANRADYEIFIHDDAGFEWSTTTRETKFTYPATAPPLQAGHRYYWVVTPRNTQGQPNSVWASSEAWFQIATPAEAAQLETDLASLQVLGTSEPGTLPIAQAALYNGLGFNDAAVALLEPLVQRAGAARSETLDALFHAILIESKQKGRLYHWYPDEDPSRSRGVDTGTGAKAVEVDLPKPEIVPENFPDSALKSYNNPDGAFRISIPLHWFVSHQEISPGLALTGFVADVNVLPDMSIATATPKRPEGQAELAKGFFAVLQKLGEFQQQPPAEVQFQGKPATRTDWKWKRAGVATRGYSLEFKRGATNFLLSISGVDEQTAEMGDAFRLAEQLLPTFSTEGVAKVEPPKDTEETLLKEIQESSRLMDDSIATNTEERTPDNGVPKALPEALTAFSDAEAKYKAAQEGTLERAKLARRAAVIATGIAWLQWDGGKRPEAAQWFTRRDALQAESDSNTFKFHEAAMVQTDKRLKELTSQTYDFSLAAYIDLAVHGWVSLQEARISLLHNAAYDSGDAERELRYALRELSLQQFALDNALLSGQSVNAAALQRIRMARAIESVGSGQESLADYAAAEKSYRLALAWRSTAPETLVDRDLNVPLRNLGVLYMATGDNVRALEAYKEALADLDKTEPLRQAGIAAETNARLHEMERGGAAQTYAVLWNNVGIITESTGDLRGAEEAYNKALQVIEPLEQTGFVGWIRASQRSTTLANLAVLRADSGEIGEALKMGEELITIRRALNDDAGTALWLLNRAGLLYERHEKGDIEEARSHIIQAQQLFTSLRQTGRVASCNIFLAKLEHEAGHLPAAEKYAREALKLARPTGDADITASADRSLARIVLDLAKNAKDAKEQKAHWTTFDALLVEASAYDKRLGSPYSTSLTLYLHAKGREERGDLKGALSDYEAAIARMEVLRSTARSQDAYSEMKGSYAYYDSIVRLLLKMNRADEAFDYLSRARSKKLQDSMRLSSIQTKDKALQTLLDLAGTLQKKMGIVRTQLETERAKPDEERDASRIENLQDLAASTQADFFRVSNQIKAANPNFEKVLTVKPVDLKKAQPSIPADTVLVQYAPLGEQLYVFVVTNNSLKIYTPKVKPDDLWKAVRQFRALMDNAQTDVRNGKALLPIESDTPLKENITSLYAMLIKPIEGELQGKSTVAIIPTGMLYYLPMHALARETPNGLRFLIEDKRVAYLAAADVLSVVQARQEGRFGQGMLALGDPSGANLPAARAEVQEIAKIYPASQVLTDASALKSALTANNLDRRVLHLATHGVLNGAHPEDSYIQLAGTGEEGKLRMGEVYGLPLNKIDLVTLSACQTALGQRDPDGGEITSLAEAFSGAGSPSVVASLWSVEDESTRKLMEVFYRDLAGGKSKSEALQSAEVALLKDKATRHPFYWAPFEVLGDWR